MNKIIFSVVAVIASVVAVQSAAAIGGEGLGCFVNVGVPGVFIEGGCLAERPRPEYDIVFRVLRGSGTYSYAWTRSEGTVVDGCTSTTEFCILHVTATRQRNVNVSATLFQSGLQNTVSATAEIQPVCGNTFC